MHRRFAASPVVVPRRSNLGRLSAVVLLACIAMAWTGCGTSLSSASATPRVTSSPTSSSAHGPVQVGLTLRQEGSVSGHTLKLIATATITNHTPQTIGILSRDHVLYPGIFYTVTSQYGTKLWDSLSHANGGFYQVYDTTTIAPGGQFTYTSTLDLFTTGGFLPGLTCLVVANVEWHTGALPDNGSVPDQSRIATGQATIAVQ